MRQEKRRSPCRKAVISYCQAPRLAYERAPYVDKLYDFSSPINTIGLRRLLMHTYTEIGFCITYLNIFYYSTYLRIISISVEDENDES